MNVKLDFTGWKQVSVPMGMDTSTCRRLFSAAPFTVRTSIGLHQRDNDMLLQTMKDLRDLGNTLLVGR